MASNIHVILFRTIDYANVTVKITNIFTGIEIVFVMPHSAH